MDDSRWPLIKYLIVVVLVGAGSFLLWRSGAFAESSSLRTYILNREGLGQFNRKNYFSAYQKFTKGLEEEPLNPELQLNLARTFQENEEDEKAEKGYRAALQLLPPGSPRRFEALFNWAIVLAKLKRIDDALAAYQLALELYPDSLEVKTNIELLFQGGGGGGSGENQDQKQDQKGDQKKDQDPQQQPDDNKDKQKKPKPFESQDLSKEDVKRILDEIKNQEQNIRAQEYEKGAREMPRAKDW